VAGPVESEADGQDDDGGQQQGKAGVVPGEWESRRSRQTEGISAVIAGLPDGAWMGAGTGRCRFGGRGRGVGRGGRKNRGVSRAGRRGRHPGVFGGGWGGLAFDFF